MKCQLYLTIGLSGTLTDPLAPSHPAGGAAQPRIENQPAHPEGAPGIRSSLAPTGPIRAPMDMRAKAFWLLVLGFGFPAAASSAGPSPALPPLPPAASALASLPAQWLDDQGRSVDLHALADRRLVLTMAYATCHRICPMTIRHLEALQRELDTAGQQATFVVVGFDPGSDEAAAWRQYRQDRGLNRPNWLFLTARDAAQVRQFADRLGFEFWRYDEHVMHDERVVVLAPGGALQLSAGPGHVLHARDLSTGT
jgi:protein SCO1